MSGHVYRCFVEKCSGFDIPSQSLQHEWAKILRLPCVSVRLFNRYDVQNLPHDQWSSVINTIFSEPMSDRCYEENLPPLAEGTRLLCVEPLPGQYDIHADTCEQCIQMLCGGQRPTVRTAQVYAIENVDDAGFNRIKAYLINPVECREASLDKPKTLLDGTLQPPEDVPVLEGFITLNAEALDSLLHRLGLAMSMSDLRMIQDYFNEEHRDPTLTELRMLDAYWSDHCRHTTFNTIIESADIQDERVKKAYEMFMSVNGDKPVTLMNIATAAMRCFSQRGELPYLDISAENNACTVRVRAQFAHGQEDWLLFFKNETHNHPTEVEPYGGAGTCLGGAIRDPLSGRAYAYQSMRITGAGDPRKPIEETLPGKLPQRKLTLTAASGFSAYGSQIGLAAGYVKEIYHEGYIAKRMEAGAMVAAAPQSWVRRGQPAPGDVVVLLGGRTGRDGIGAAAGSSKTHSTSTVSECAAEVQKGSAQEERKLQRLFRKPAVTTLIKRCNDFGAGGASVAIGELADGVEILLDAIPAKYPGLDGTELALSESQERMALVVAERDLPTLVHLAEAENLETAVVARITEDRRLVMKWRDKKIVDISRDFLNKNGAARFTTVCVPPCRPKSREYSAAQSPDTGAEKLFQLASGLNFCSQKGLVERFDASIGAASIFVPYGGKYERTETQVMAALLPGRNAQIASVMAYGFDPSFTEEDPFGGSAFAVVSSIAKLVAAGVALETIHLTFQEYFPRVNDDPVRWGLPFAAMLGAFSAQMGLNIAAVGGKDSMSGSFDNLDVPPTLISFAVGVAEAPQLISPEFKKAGHPVSLLETPLDADGLPDYAALRTVWENFTELCRSGKVLSAWVCERGGVYGGIMKMGFGNEIGFSGEADEAFFDNAWGSIIFESSEVQNGFRLLGHTQAEPVLNFGGVSVPLAELRTAWESPLESVFPVKAEQSGDAPLITDQRTGIGVQRSPWVPVAKPRAVIPVFPGTNGEYDTASALDRAGGIAEVLLIRNRTPEMLSESIAELEKAIASAQMLIFPGGGSGGDDPGGSSKYIVSLFCNVRLTDAVHDLLQKRDGLILGINQGFQALLKLGLLPGGRIAPITAESPTLTLNRIGRHQARYVTTRVASVVSPWMSLCVPGDMHVQPVSHSEGRFAATADVLNVLKENGQIVSQYVDHTGQPSMDIAYNPSGSVWAVEGLCSADGRVLGKMTHAERSGELTAKNIYGNQCLPLFASGVRYFL